MFWTSRRTHKRILWTFETHFLSLKPCVIVALLFVSLFCNRYNIANAASIQDPNVEGELTSDGSDAFHLNVTNLKVLTSEKYLEIRGHGFDLPKLRDISFHIATDAHKCNKSERILRVIAKSESSILLELSDVLTKGETMYLCYQETLNSSLVHLGAQHKFISNTDDEFRIYGFRVEHAEKEHSMNDAGITKTMADQTLELRIFGIGITEETGIAFTKYDKGDEYATVCQVTSTKVFKVSPGSIRDGSALVTVTFGAVDEEYFICAKPTHQGGFLFQGTDDWMKLIVHTPMLPIWLQLMIIGICLMFSALFSGLNLGLMSLDRTDLKILCNTGTENEQQHARTIQPVRDHGNYLLCSILLGNVLVNSTFTILLDGLTSGLLAVVFSTLLIVVFGEITPQAICSRHGLAVGAKTIWVTKAVMLITFPLSYPTSKILDYLLGEEIGNVYNRERLKELVKVTTDINDLDRDEVNVISGVLELRKKTVSEVMTHIEDAFMLSIDAILDFETVSEIMKSGFSRVPVYEGEKNNIVTLLYIKDLAFVDPDDNTPLKTLCEFYQNPCHFVFDDLTLDIMFKQFKEGNKGHMAFVHRVNNEGDGDPFYETIGLVTMEDVIEELIQAEIMDETDVYTDNRKKVRRKRTKEHDFTVFVERKDNQRMRISPQLTLATFQYLSTTLDAFKPDQVSETILRRLLNQDIVRHIKCKGKDKNDESMFIYQTGKPVDYFVLILEGRVEVLVGKENMMFEAGPFTYFGKQALIQNVTVADSPSQIMGSLQSLNMDALIRHTFIPDYSVKAVTETIYLAIKRNLYLAAKRATLMERKQRCGDPTSDAIDDEVEKLLHSLDDDDPSVHASVPNLNGNTPKASKPASPTTIVNDSHSNGMSGPATPVNVPISTSLGVFNPNNRSNSLNYTVQREIGANNTDEEIQAPLLPRSKS
ncbi:unextended protein [Culicoides brevitarsis]|uniref:unextended protein n=1 Tax=Culicoides brevitarsis TaxID=469753 RepID=UPI00307C7B8E